MTDAETSESTGTTAASRMLVNRVRKNLKRLRPWTERERITCFRIYDRDIPEIPLSIDDYEGRLHVALWARGGGFPDEDLVEALLGALSAELGIPREGIFVKQRRRQQGGSQYDRADQQRARFTVTEDGLAFQVNLSDYVDTGLFLDHRRMRAKVRAESEGRHALNLFSYTGAFSVHAAAGGARSTTSVDLSNTYLDWTERNLRLNGFDGDEHTLVRDDARAFLADHRPPDDGYGVIVLDPPTHSRSKRTDADLDIQRDHAALLKDCLRLCRTGGTIFFSTNYRKFKLDAPLPPKTRIEEITKQTIPFDYRDQRIHRAWRIEKT